MCPRSGRVQAWAHGPEGEDSAGAPDGGIYLLGRNSCWRKLELPHPSGQGASLVALMVEESTCSVGDPGLVPGSGRSPGEQNGNPLWYSCLENPMNRGTRWATVVELETAVTKTHKQWAKVRSSPHTLKGQWQSHRLPTPLRFPTSRHSPITSPQGPDAAAVAPSPSRDGTANAQQILWGGGRRLHAVPTWGRDPMLCSGSKTQLRIGLRARL